MMLLTILLTGLSAGLFYAWSISVIPGIKRIPDKSYLEAMQEINRAILNPWFFILFFGAALMMIYSAYLQFKTNAYLSFWIILCAAVIYLAGTVGITAFGNVPLNQALDQVQLNILNTGDLQLTRQAYEGQWNKLHTIRTFFSVVSFLLLLLAAVRYNSYQASTGLL